MSAATDYLTTGHVNWNDVRAGAAGGAVYSAVDQQLNYGCIDWGQVGVSAAVGGATSWGVDWLGGKASSWLSGKASKPPAGKTTKPIPGLIFRIGSQTDNALTDANGVSFRDSISISTDRTQVFRPGDKMFAADTSKLPAGSVVADGNPDGHVSVFASPDEIRQAVVDVPWLDLPRLPDGSYRLPR